MSLPIYSKWNLNDWDTQDTYICKDKSLWLHCKTITHPLHKSILIQTRCRIPSYSISLSHLIFPLEATTATTKDTTLLWMFTLRFVLHIIRCNRFGAVNLNLLGTWTFQRLLFGRHLLYLIWVHYAFMEGCITRSPDQCDIVVLFYKLISCIDFRFV